MGEEGRRFTVLAMLSVVAGLSLAALGGWELHRGVSSRSWPTAAGVIHTTNLRVHRDSEGKKYWEVFVWYCYEVGRYKTRCGERISLDGLTSLRSKAEADAVARRYPPGMNVTVWYDPNQPRTAVLEPGPAFRSYGALALGAFLLLVAAGLRYTGRTSEVSESRARMADALNRVRGALALELSWLENDQGARLHGRVDDVEVTATFRRQQASWQTEISVSCDAPLVRRIHLQPSRAVGTVKTRDIETGDRAFDALFDVAGSAPVALVLLTPPARERLKDLARAARVTLRDGQLTYEWEEPALPKGSVGPLVRRLIAAMGSLPRVADIPEALADLAAGDPEEGVRARCLATLIEEYAEHPRVAAALDVGISDRSDAVRLVAATAAGPAGEETLREIATRKDGAEEVAARALAVLGQRWETNEVLKILDASLVSKRRVVAVSAIQVLGRLDAAGARTRLAALVGGDDAELASAAARALATTPSDEGERILLRALDARLRATVRADSRASGGARDVEAPERERVVERAVIHALGRVGGAGSLARLHALVDEATDRAEGGHDLQSVARQAIAAIRSRLPEASVGRLSLPVDAGGEVSLAADHPSGRVSLAEKESAE